MSLFFKKESSIAEKGTYLSFIDGLRGIAILSVLVVHSLEAVESPFGLFHWKSMDTFFGSGARGVQLFFIISAFTLFSSSKRRFDTEPHPYFSFYVRRAFRILPFWWLTNLAYMILSGWTFTESLPSFMMYFGFIRYKPHVELVPYGWSIFVEETFYLFLPLLFLYIKDIYRAFYFFFIMFAAQYLWFGRLSVKLGFPDVSAFYFCFPLSQWFYFGIGIVLYFLINSEGFQRKITDNKKIQSVLTAALALFTYYFFAGGNYVLAAIPLTLLFIASVPAKSLVGRIVRTPILIHFGRYCYSIYLIHGLLLSFTTPYLLKIFNFVGFKGHPVEIAFVAYFVWIAVISFFAGAFFFNTVEKPFVNLGKFVIKKFIWAPSRRLASRTLVD